MSSAAIESFNADIQHSLEALSGDEAMLKRVAKYLRRLVRERAPDPTCMTEEEYFAMLDRGEEEYRQGKTHSINSIEELDAFLERL